MQLKLFNRSGPALHYVNGVCTPLTSRLRYAALSKFG